VNNSLECLQQKKVRKKIKKYQKHEEMDKAVIKPGQLLPTEGILFLSEGIVLPKLHLFFF
jgi:hypothetical protein